jgi:hypothetical protein
MAKSRILNPVETEAARSKLAEIRTTFSEWVWSDQARAERLARHYNETFNNLRLRKYDGSHLTFPGSSSHITLRPEQKDAAWRIITSPATMLALFPGWGKTFVMISSLMEMKRLRLKTKGLFVVPNHLVAQFAAEFLQLYPTARVLMADTEDFAKANRRLFMAKMATGAHDAIIIPHSAFVKLPLRPENESIFLAEQLEELEEMLTSKAIAEDDRITVKALESAKSRLKAKLDDLRARTYPDDTIFLEDTGVDFLACDEAHYMKNVPISSKMTRVAGVPTGASARALDLAVKARWLLSKYRTGLVLSTGTPIANTLAELYIWENLMIPGTLRKMGHQHFDAWAGTWGSTVSQLELKPEGTGYRVNSRFARFANVPELSLIFNSFAEVRVLEDSTLPRPALVTGAPIVVPCDGAPELKPFIRGLAERAKRIRSGLVKPDEDNMLAVTVDGRKASLDMRVVSPGIKDFPGSKVNQCAAKVAELHRQFSADRAVQLIYCDLSTPNREGFSIYRDLKGKLIALGVPDAEVAFIHDYQDNADRLSLFQKLRDGTIRVLIASTEKAGTGMNVQNRLIAEHHLDVPWRPCDIEQREGRIIRFGNMFSNVFIYRYVTSLSFDAYVWSILVVKAHFIHSIMRAKGGARTAFDVDNVILSYEETKALASGNPMIIEKAGVDADVMKLSLQQQQHAASRLTCRTEMGGAELLAKRKGQWLANAAADRANQIPTAADQFKITLGEVTYTERPKAAAALAGALRQPECARVHSGYDGNP